MIGRGDKDGSFTANVDVYKDKIRQMYNCVTWNPFPVDVWVGTYISWVDPGFRSPDNLPGT